MGNITVIKHNKLSIITLYFYLDLWSSSPSQHQSVFRGKDTIGLLHRCYGPLFQHWVAGSHLNTEFNAMAIFFTTLCACVWKKNKNRKTIKKSSSSKYILWSIMSKTFYLNAYVLWCQLSWPLILYAIAVTNSPPNPNSEHKFCENFSGLFWVSDISHSNWSTRLMFPTWMFNWIIWI